MRAPLLTFAAAFLLAAAPVAHADSGVNSPAAQYINALGNQALSTISDKKLSSEKKQAVLQTLFKANLDFDWVGKFVMGRYWREATDDQKARYMAAYREFLTKNYTSRFSEYTSGSFKITGARELEKGDSLVNMEIAGNDKSEPPVVIDYKLHKVSGNFKVYDIIVEGVSMITSQRSEFNSVINKNGIDGLIAKLASK